MERALQYMWEYRMYSGAHRLCDGSDVKLLSPGKLNHDSGPDFSNARISINGTLWAGNVEIHLRASDWYRHGHHNDPAYDNIILHVVSVDDTRIQRSDGTEIPQMVLPLTPKYINLYAQLVTKGTVFIRCGNLLSSISPLSIHDYIDALGMQRLQQKADRILSTLQRHHGDWHQTSFATLARALGFGVNAEPFEMLANRLPLNIIHHHSDNTEQIEALLFGMAGLLDPNAYPEDAYHRFLCNEFAFLSRKYSLSPMPGHLWKRSRMRPAASPCRRLALMARMLTAGFTMLRDLLETGGKIDRMQRLFDIRMQDYWADHYSFGTPTQTAAAALGPQSIDLLLINVAAPLFYAYGMATGNPALEDTALEILQNLGPEKNGIINTWSTLGLKPRNAFESQALLHLRREYCDNHRCLECRWGNKLLRSAQFSP